MSDFGSLLEGYDRLQQEMEILQKYGRDYRMERNRTRAIVERLHPKRLQLKVAELIEETYSTRTFRLVARNGYLPPFQAGQYINLFVNVDGLHTSRPYTISSSPPGRLGITTLQLKECLVDWYPII